MLRGRRTALAVMAGCFLACGGAAEPPNVVLYVADALRADALAPYGNPVVETPNLARLAREGTLFERAYAASSWTRASVASLLTGRAPWQHGAERRRDKLGDDVELLSEHLRRRGYATACIIANPNVGPAYGFDRGCDTFVEIYPRGRAGSVQSLQLTERAIGWIRGTPRPFFLFVLAIDPHHPYEPPEGFDRYGRDDGSRPVPTSAGLTPAQKQRVRSLYHGEVTALDDGFGRLIEFLRAERVLDDTVVAFTADHGEELWEHGRIGHGRTLYDEVLRVPLILRYPAAVAAGTRSTAPVTSEDVFHALVWLAGATASGAGPPPLLHAGGDDERPLVSRLRLDGLAMDSVVLGPWKLIEDHSVGASQLFDLRDDPGERRDVAHAHPEVLARLAPQLAGQDASHPGAVQVPDHALSAEARRALEALGYLDPDGP